MEPLETGVGETPERSWMARLSGHAAGALRYWEPKRALYNVALSGVVLVHFLLAMPGAAAKLTMDLVLGLFVLAVLANLCYCAAYVPDLFVQFAGLRDGLRNARVGLFVIGTIFAAVVAHFMAASIFR